MHPPIHVSVYPSTKATAPSDRRKPLASILARIRGDHDDRFPGEVESIAEARELVATGKVDAYRTLKANRLAAFTPAGCFETSHCKGGMAKGQRSGCTVVDVDDQEPERVAELRGRGEDLPGCRLAFASPSDRGVKYIVALSPCPQSAAAHEAATIQVQAAYAAKLGVEVDASGKDESRLCFFSRDPYITEWPDAEPFEWDIEAAASPTTAPVNGAARWPDGKAPKTPADVGKLPEGERNNGLFVAVTWQAENGKLTPDLEAQFAAAALAGGQTPDEVAGTITSGRKQGTATRDRKTSGGFPAEVSAPLIALRDTPPGQLPAALAAIGKAARGMDPAGLAAVKLAAVNALKAEHGAVEARELVKASLAGASGGTANMAGSALTFAEVKAAPEPAPLADILHTLTGHLRRFMHLPPGAAETVAAWVAWTYVEPHSYILPILAVTAPTKGCGKSTLLRVMARFIERPNASSTPTPAALFRFVESHHPTLMLDEADVWMKGRDDGAAAVRAVVNEGHMRGGGVLRCVGDDHEVRRFRCDCPKAIAGIGDFMAPATADRCIIITLDKAPRSVRLDNFRGDHPLAPELPGLLKRWAADHGDEYAAHDPDTGRLTGRDADNWRPLYGVADLAGGEWPRRIREAAEAVYGRADKRTEKRGRNEQLLTDAFKVFDAQASATLETHEFDTALLALPDAPYRDWTRGKAITPQARGRILNTFGINVSEGGGLRWYDRTAFVDAWDARGIPPREPDGPDEPDRQGPTQSGSSGSSGSRRGGATPPAVPVEQPAQVMLDQGEAAHARDVDAMSDAMNPDPREPIGPEPDPVPAPLLDRPKQPHVDHVTDLGPAVGKPVRRDLRVRQERVEGALWWTQPTAVELTEEQVFTEALGADLRATMEGCAEGKVLNTFDAWWAHNGDALDAAMRMGGES